MGLDRTEVAGRTARLLPGAIAAVAVALAGLFGFGSGAATAQAPTFRPLGTVLPSEPNGYPYAYAPTIMRIGATWHVWFCSTGADGAWDFVRHATSPDGRNWSAPAIVLRGVAAGNERAACDPSTVRFQAPGDARPYFYLFYSGAPLGVGTALFVARAETPEGPFAKWTGSGWDPDGAAAPIIRPAAPHPDGSGFYGAGQQSVVVVNGALRAWYTDDTTCTPRCERIFETEARDPTRWSPSKVTDVRLSSVDVKWDVASRRFVMLGIANPHAFGSFLARYVSADGVTWGKPEIVAQPTGFTHYAHNVGQSGDEQGHTLPGDTLVMFGAPMRAECGICWAHWDLAAALIGPAGTPRP